MAQRRGTQWYRPCAGSAFGTAPQPSSPPRVGGVRIAGLLALRRTDRSSVSRAGRVPASTGSVTHNGEGISLGTLHLPYPSILSWPGRMAHTIRDKQKLISRVRRIRGQIEAIERALAREEDCTRILQTIAASRGAINGLMAEVVEDQIRVHVANPGPRAAARRSRVTGTQHAKETDDLIAVIKTYLK